jgi:hypothetical protein
MKKIIVFILCVIFCSFLVQSQNVKDTLNKQGKIIEKRIIVTDNESGDEDIMIDANCPMGHNDQMSGSCCQNSDKHMRFMKGFKNLKNHFKANVKHLSYSQKALVLMPVILFLFVFIIFLFWLRRENFKLSDTLSSHKVEIIKTTHTHTDPNDPTKTITETHEEAFYPKSSSRLLALLTGFTAIIIAICAITYFAYFSINLCTIPPHFGGLWIIFFILGIGIIPYAIKTMFKK